jgi:hypothetical protein
MVRRMRRVKPGERYAVPSIVRQARVVDKDKPTQIAYTPILMEVKYYSSILDAIDDTTYFDC